VHAKSNARTVEALKSIVGKCCGRMLSGIGGR
jgi:hypothetical protein